jgi:DNA-binding NarL/FixJ family response regulator
MFTNGHEKPGNGNYPPESGPRLQFTRQGAIRSLQLSFLTVMSGASGRAGQRTLTSQTLRFVWKASSLGMARVAEEAISERLERLALPQTRQGLTVGPGVSMSCNDQYLVARREPVTLPDDLTERQVRVLRLLRGSLTLPEIATELSLSPNTVKTHTRAIYRKLGVCTREEAVTRGLDRGILTPSIRSH